jgi:hypothetical protein
MFGVGVGVRVRGTASGSGIAPYVGLLDDYPSAAAAYSVRLLSGAYTGNAIRVRRSSDNAEQNIGFTALGNLDTTALTTFCSGTDGFITTWYDQSGNSRDAIQTIAINQPQIVSSGSIVTENGKSAIQYNGIPNGLTITNRPLTGATSFSVFSIVNLKTANNYEMIFVQTDGLSNDGRLEIRRNSTNNSLQYLGNDNSGSSMNGTLPINNTQILSSYIGFSNVATAYINNSLDATSTNTNINIGNYPSQIGQRGVGFSLNGIIQEVVVYASNQSSNRSGINSNINSYYAIY